ncbi:MAG: methylmalonyl-CoA epimerase [Robiginitomaculum sp.]|nr:MAG: methylmalonyl-CoA epimerase [Robiginitomaculum sp.]
MIGRLNHIGIATTDVEKAAKTWRELYGATHAHEAFDMPAQGVRVKFIDVPNSQIELIEPLGKNSPLDAFLAKNPAGGQHHVCFEVADILVARDDMRAKGARILGTGEPRIGAHGTPVIFVHPKDSGGVLVELMQAPQEKTQ